MKMRISRLLALVLALTLLMGMAMSANAMDLKEAASVDAADMVGQSVTNFSAEDNPGIFGLKISKGTNSYMTAAFLIQNGEYRYLLTDSIVVDYYQDDYDLTLLVRGGVSIPVICGGYDSGYNIAYLYAEGTEVYTPLRVQKGPFTGTIVAGLPYCDDALTECRRIEYKAFDFSKWSAITTSLYALSGSGVPDNWLGSPIFKSATDPTVYGMGTYYQTGDTYTAAVVNFSDMTLYADYSLELMPATLTAEQERGSEEKPETGEDDPTTPTKPDDGGGSHGDEEKLDSKILVLAGIVIAAAIYYFYSKKQKEQARKKAEEAEKLRAEQEKTQGVTIPLDPTDRVTHGVTKALSNWQLRAVGGPLDGKTYALSGVMKIGRSSGSEIRFPESTAGISGNHCQVILSGDTVKLKDVGSTYGTYVGEKRLAPNVEQTLYAGDSFTLSQKGPAFRLERTGAAGGSTQPGPAVRDLQGKTYQADSSGRLTFGRSSSNRVILSSPDNAISGSHCVLYREGGKLYLKDLGSTNGTFFSEKERLKPNTPYRIRRGQAFFLCAVKYTFVVTEE